MSIDIVTRLRLRPTILRKNRFGDMETDRAATALFDDCHAIMREAADEIERLRNALVDSEREVTMLTRGMRRIIDNAQNEPLAADYARSLLEGRQTNCKDGRVWKNESLQD